MGVYVLFWKKLKKKFFTFSYGLGVIKYSENILQISLNFTSQTCILKMQFCIIGQKVRQMASWILYILSIDYQTNHDKSAQSGDT